MDIILNDYSIVGQFKDEDEFADSLTNNTFPMLKWIVSYSRAILKSYTTYSNIIFDKVSLHEFLTSQKFRGFAEAQQLRIFLSQLEEEPYWQEESKTDESACYYCEEIGAFDGKEANCISETLERNGILCSLEHKDFLKSIIQISKNGILHEIKNCYDRSSMGDILVHEKKIGLSEYLLSKKYARKIQFSSHNGKYYADQPYDEGELSISDLVSIQKDFKMSLEYINRGQLKSRFSDSITYKKITYYEFRCSLQNNREFRIYYYVHNDNLIYLNSLIKKTQTIPDTVKDKSVSLIKDYLE